MTMTMQTWELWYPDAGNTGLPFARARIDPTEVLWVHAAPPVVTATVRAVDERVVARGERLEREGQRYPMTRLTCREGRLNREDRWPTDADLGTPVILPGGEVGRLVSWWNAVDGSAWRWRIELYNHV
jgi:hypothetical protein